MVVFDRFAARRQRVSVNNRLVACGERVAVVRRVVGDGNRVAVVSGVVSKRVAVVGAVVSDVGCVRVPGTDVARIAVDTVIMVGADVAGALVAAVAWNVGVVVVGADVARVRRERVPVVGARVAHVDGVRVIGRLVASVVRVVSRLIPGVRVVSVISRLVAAGSTVRVISGVVAAGSRVLVSNRFVARIRNVRSTVLSCRDASEKLAGRSGRQIERRASVARPVLRSDDSEQRRVGRARDSNPIAHQIVSRERRPSATATPRCDLADVATTSAATAAGPRR